MIQFTKETLREALAGLRVLKLNKQTLPVLRHVRVTGSETSVEFAGTDLDQSLCYEGAGTSPATTRILVPCEQLQEVAKQADAGSDIRIQNGDTSFIRYHASGVALDVPFTPIASEAAKHLRLIDMPVIPLRRWFEAALNRKPPSYETLVRSSLEVIQNRLGDVMLELGPKSLGPEEKDFWMRLNGIEHRLSPQRYAYLRFFAEEAKAGIKADARIIAPVDRYVDWCKTAFAEEPRCHQVIATAESIITQAGGNKGSPKLVEILPQRMNDLRTFLSPLSGGQALSAALPSKGRWGLDVASERITLH